MIACICLLLPSVLSVWIYEGLRKEDLSVKRWLYHYALSVIAVNFLCFFVKQYILGTGEFPLWNFYTDVTPSAAANYLIMAVPAAAVFGIIRALLVRSVKIEIEDSHNDKA